MIDYFHIEEYGFLLFKFYAFTYLLVTTLEKFIKGFIDFYGMKDPFDEYKSDLESQLAEGIISQEDFEEALEFLEGSEGKRKGLEFEVTYLKSEVDGDNVRKLEDWYFREIFGRPRIDADLDIDGNNILIAKANDLPVAVLWYAHEPDESYKGCLYIDKLFTLEEHRRNNVAAQLIAEMVRNRDLDAINAVIVYSWERAKEFYHSIGFLNDGDGEIMEKEGEYFLKMVLPLTTDSYDRYCSHENNGGEAVVEMLPDDVVQRYVEGFALVTETAEGDQVFSFDNNPFLIPLRSKLGSK